MNVQSLKIILLVAQHGSIAGAARVLEMDPSSVSRIVSNFEKEIGLRLFQRTTRFLKMSEEGELYLNRVGPLLDELEAARENALQLKSTPSGTLKLTASVAFAHECIVPLLPAFHQLYPKILIELIPTDANVDLLADGVDLAIRLTTAPDGNYITTRILPTRYRVVAAPDYISSHGPIDHPGQLSEHNCLRFSLPDFRSRWIFRTQNQAPFEVAVSGQTLIANALSIRQAARNGMGPVLLADWLIERDLKTGRLVDLFPAFEASANDFDTGAWALYPSRNFLPQKVRVMIDFLRENLSKTGGLKV